MSNEKLIEELNKCKGELIGFKIMCAISSFAAGYLFVTEVLLS